jgi:tRNA threonylcarbamoyladenosine biosynthesis protein TsaE
MAEVEPETLASRSFRSHSTEATEAFGAALARAIEAQPILVLSGAALTLEGELGSGKTAVVRGVAAGLGASDRVHSPSFTLMHTYEGRLPIYHFDAWMEGRERAFLEGGGAEWLDRGGLAVIEWASRVEAWLPLPRLGLLLEHMGASDPNTRRLVLSACSGELAAQRDPRSRAMAEVVRGLKLSDVQAPRGSIEEA